MNCDKVDSSSISEDYHSNDSQSSMQAISEPHEIQVFEHVDYAMPPIQDYAFLPDHKSPITNQLHYIVKITTELE